MAILIDAFVIRLVLVPAVMHLMDERMWYMPRWLDRVLPRLTIEPPTGTATPAERPGRRRPSRRSRRAEPGPQPPRAAFGAGGGPVLGIPSGSSDQPAPDARRGSATAIGIETRKTAGVVSAPHSD